MLLLCLHVSFMYLPVNFVCLHVGFMCLHVTLVCLHVNIGSCMLVSCIDNVRTYITPKHEQEIMLCWILINRWRCNLILCGCSNSKLLITFSGDKFS